MKYIKAFENKKPEKKVKYHKNGNIESIEYILNGNYHREDGPAYLRYKNGQKYYEVYYINGKYHRENGPSVIYWEENGQIYHEIYYINNLKHRENGPASIFYSNDKIISKYYYINGNKYYNIEDWLKVLKKINSPHYKEQQYLYDIEKNSEKYNL